MAYCSRWPFCSETEPEGPKLPRVRNYPALPYQTSCRTHDQRMVQVALILVTTVVCEDLA